MAPRVLLILALLLVGLTAAAPAAETYHGRVLDADTKQPLQGAVVTVIWMKYPFGSTEGVSDFHGAREAVTDADGRFSIDATPPRKWNPFRALHRRPEIIVFKPGYGRYPDMYWMIVRPGLPPIESVGEPLQARQAATIELPKLESEKDLKIFAGHGLHPNVPWERVPIYLELVNEHAARLGLEPYREPKH